MRLCLEQVEVVDDLAAEECASVGQRGLVHDDLRASCLDALHHALYAALAEVVAPRLHREAIHADDASARVVDRLAAIAVAEGEAKHAVGDVVLAGAVALHDGFDEVLGHVGKVGKQLLGVLGQAVTAIAERRIVVVHANARVEAHAGDDGQAVEAFHLGIGVEFVEETHAKGQIGVGKKFHRLGLGQPHEQDIDIGLAGALLQDLGKGVRRVVQAHVAIGTAHDDAAGVKVVVECFGLAKELGSEEDVVGACSLSGALGVADGYRRFDDDDCLGIHLDDKVDDLIDVCRVEVIGRRVIVGGGGNHHILGLAIGLLAIERGG